MARRLSPRFGAEATALALTAALMILLEVGTTAAVAVIFALWLAIAALELVAPSRPEEPAAEEPAVAEPVGTREEAAPDWAVEPQPLAGAEPFAPDPYRPAEVPAASEERETAEELQPLAVSPFDERAPAPVSLWQTLAAAPARHADESRPDAEADPNAEAKQ